MKRYCQMMEMPNDAQLLEKYREVHANVWPIIKEGIREVGILDMQIFMRGNVAFMIMDTTDDFDFVADTARLMTLPRQREWEAYVAEFQGKDPNADSTEKWQIMENIFLLNE
mgnify:CR=1 FL=1